MDDDTWSRAVAERISDALGLTPVADTSRSSIVVYPHPGGVVTVRTPDWYLTLNRHVPAAWRDVPGMEAHPGIQFAPIVAALTLDRPDPDHARGLAVLTRASDALDGALMAVVADWARKADLPRLPDPRDTRHIRRFRRWQTPKAQPSHDANADQASAAR